MSEETSIPSGLDAARRLQAAIRISMNTGSFYDTKFFVFSRRRSGSGLIDTPRPVYANSALLKAASPYCQTLLASGFQESRVVNINTTYPPEWPSHLETYDYEDDSDFEDEESLTEPEDSEVSSSGTTSESLPDATSEPTEVNVDHVIEPTPRLGRTVLISNAAYATWNALVYYIFTGEVVFKTLRSCPAMFSEVDV
ncbi:hypothetical protein EUX98_g8128 [Antrodiella citrinella]|uniref:BTB domain-containing protein n=1 Tax=Antrodiella citrinella TaxID=2447956 RepID=A0A4S4MCB3_9APHY|nr:hypothetical protein EUX98_g8128 [Antrodiella citrinella]